MVNTVVVSGIFSRFEAYRTPTPQEYGKVMQTGLVVLDTNVLLSLYRYNDKARQDLLDVLEQLGRHLWIPHQVVKEFWGARMSALYDRERRAERVRTDIQKSFEQIRVQLRNWASSVSLDDEQLAAMLGVINGCADEIEEGVLTVAAVETERSHWLDTNQDPVVTRLEAILQGRVGEPFSEDEDKDVRKEAARRVEHKIPPGYKDAEKDQKKGVDAGDSAGDYFVWEQLLREAERRKCDVLFVTADVKDDWWRRRSEQLLGPRAELVDELRARSGGRLCMLQPHEFLRTANESFNLNLDPESVASVERTDSTYEGSGWTKEGLRALLLVLEDQAPTRAKVIRRAIEQGGYVSREEVYEIGGYNENRMLTGWTRPIRTWTQYLRDKGEIPSNEGTTDVLEVQYERGDGRARGFKIPEPMMELFAELGEDD